jgi:AcrR family transcriptional regulator
MARPGTPANGSDERVDGRRARREANRAAVVQALVALNREGNLSPSAAEVAARAGLSQRSLFRYFDDVDDLNRAAIEEQLARARPLLKIGARSSDPTPVKIRRLVESRSRQYEVLAPVARAARATSSRHPVVAGQVREARAFWREQLRRLFAPELDAMPRDRSNAVLAAADVLCSFESWDLLRSDQGLAEGDATATLSAALAALFDTDAT